MTNTNGAVFHTSVAMIAIIAEAGVASQPIGVCVTPLCKINAIKAPYLSFRTHGQSTAVTAVGNVHGTSKMATTTFSHHLIVFKKMANSMPITNTPSAYTT